jgi:transposase
LPPDLLPWRTVYKPFEARREDGTWERMLSGLRRQVRRARRQHHSIGAHVRKKEGRHGYDAGKQVA